MKRRPPTTKNSGRGSRAVVKGSGAVAQGTRAKAAGKRGVVADVVNGNVSTGDTFQLIYQRAEHPGANKATLRNAYLAWISMRANEVPLLADDGGKPVRLASLYTALLTRYNEREDVHQAHDQRRMFTDHARSQAALEALDQEQWLVLMGGPGSGKTTFLNFVALCMAGEALDSATANLTLLRTPLPQKPGDKPDTKPKAQRWRHRALLPVRVVLRDFAADLPAAGASISADTLWHFIVKQLPGCLQKYGDDLQAELLSKKGGLVLLDGLDEVPEAFQRREQIKQAVQEFAGVYRNCRFLVTSRTYAYQHQNWKLAGFAERELSPFTPGQIERFIDTWYAHLSHDLMRLTEAEAQARTDALKRATRREQLRELAQRPLLLTLMARIQMIRGGGLLPESRHEIYAQSVDMLLEEWESNKKLYAKGRLIQLQPSVSEWLNSSRERIRVELEKLAYQAHLNQPALVGTADIRQTDVVNALLAASKDLPDAKIMRLEEYLRDRAGLLTSHGEGLYQFPHRSFQEYLAACHLARHQFPDALSEHVKADPNRWREVLLLTVARSKPTPSSIWELVDTLCSNDPPLEPDRAAQWGALLAGDALREAGLCPPNPELQERHENKRQRVRNWQLRLLASSALPARERALAGDVLAQLGDPRFDPQRFHLPADDTLGFVHIPADAHFRIGTRRTDAPRVAKIIGFDVPQDELNDDATPTSEFYIARYPVTVAQFSAFVQATRFELGDNNALTDPDNRPVRRVSLHEAIAYCEWLGEQLKTGKSFDGTKLASLVRSGRWRISLPSELEWEKAARGGRPDAVFSWGDDPDAEQPNYESTVSDTSTVGCYPPNGYGLFDTIGNVWEWTQSLYAPYPYQRNDGRENIDAGDDALRVLRGGSWFDHRAAARCACRDWYPPYVRNLDVGFRVVLRPSHIQTL